MAGKKRKQQLLTPQRTKAVRTVIIAEHSVTPNEKTPAKKKAPPPATKKKNPAKKKPSKGKRKAAEKVPEEDKEDAEEEEIVEEAVEGMSEETPLAEFLLTPETKGRSAITQAKSASKSKSRQPAAKKGTRVKARHSILFHCLPAELHHYIPESDENFVNYFGTVESKTKECKASYDIRWDFCRGGGLATGLCRNIFTTLKKGEDELKVDPRYEKRLEEEAEDIDAIAKPDEETQTEKEFCAMEKEELLSAKTFTYKPNNRKNSGSEPIVWTILDTKEDVTNCPEFKGIKKYHDKGPSVDEQVAKDLQTMKNSEFFLHYMFPDMEGLAAKMDKFYTNPKAENYQTVRDRKLKFHDKSEAENPDWKLYQSLLLLVKGAVVSGKGIIEYWKSGKLESGLDAADFGQHMELNEFKAIVAALPYMWSDPNYWHRDKRDRPWEIFVPFIEAWNKKQQALFANYNIMTVDESMLAWVPKTSKLGGLPNYTLEPRKPKPLGTMLKDIAEVQTGMLIFTDPLMPPSVQDKKTFGREKSTSPADEGTNNSHPPHVAETLRQAFLSGCQPGKAWIRGNAWFGSVACCIALKKQPVTHIDPEGEEIIQPLNVESSFVIKNNTSLFPRSVLFAIMKARYPTRRSGNWVVMTTTIQGVKLTAICYAWNNSDILYVLTTCGNTNTCQQPYVAFDPTTGYDTSTTREVPRPEIVDFLMRFLPCIDVYNKVRQSSLQLEENWHTQCCWFKLLNAFMGQSIVNHQRLLQYVCPDIPGKDLTITDMAATISQGLKVRNRKVLPQGLRQEVSGLALKRITDANDNTTKKVTAKDKNKRSKGSAIQKTCFVCRKYLPKGEQSWTSFACPKCGTAICQNTWTNRPYTTCFYEHLNCGDTTLRCNNSKAMVKMPNEKRLHPSWH